jgi:hypothetical protein
LTVGLKQVGTNSLQRDFVAGTLRAVERKQSSGEVHFEHDAPCGVGDIGGPLVKLDGRMIGINAQRTLAFYPLLLRSKTFTWAVRPDLEWLNETIEKHNASLSGP